MKVQPEFKNLVYRIANLIIEKFRNKEFQNEGEEQIVIEATMIKVCINNMPSILEKLSKEKGANLIELTDDAALVLFCQNNHLFNLVGSEFESFNRDDINAEQVIEKWEQTRIKGIERYFNTSNAHYNNNAFYWHLELKRNSLFPDMEVAFEILWEYLHFLPNASQPLSCVDRLNAKMDKYELNKEQRLFIYDKLLGLITNEEVETRNDLMTIYLTILDYRLDLAPYENLDTEKYSIEHIVQESLQYEDLYERLKFLKHRKLEYEREAEELQDGIGLEMDIQIEIEVLEKMIDSKANLSKNAKLAENDKARIKKLVGQNKIKQVIDYLIENGFGNNETLLLSARFVDLNRNARKGVIDNGEINLTRNRIIDGLLGHIDDL